MTRYKLEAEIDADVLTTGFKDDDVLIRIIIGGRARATKILSLSIRPSEVQEETPSAVEEEE